MSTVQWWFRRRWSQGRSPGYPPTLGSLVPNTALHGAASVALTVNGTNFQPGAKINFGASPYTATFVNSRQITATIAAADLATAGSKNVTVTSPSGQVSNVLVFTIT
jgi:IPT/TIG domain-containing protein